MAVRVACAQPEKVLRLRNRASSLPELRRAAIAGPGGLLAVVAMVFLVGCGGALSFRRLHADAAAVPVPAGVTFVRESRAVNGGAGFTTTKFEEVAREFRNPLACSRLEQAWSTALHRGERTFSRWDYPHMAGGAGQFGLTITDRPEHLGVTLGQWYAGTQRCRSPFIYAYDDPH